MRKSEARHTLGSARRLLESPPPPPTEEQIDEIYDEVVESPPEYTELEPFPSADDLPEGSITRLSAATILLANVLQTSEFVADVDLKASALKTVVRGWSLGTIMLSVLEDETGSLQELIDDVIPIVEGRRGAPPDPEQVAKRARLVQHITRVFVVAVMSTLLTADVGSQRLQKVLDLVFADKEFMGDTASALLVAHLYSRLRMREWPKRLRTVYDVHGRHPIVRQLIRTWALTDYQTETFSRADEHALEELIVEVLTPEQGRAQSVPDRAAQKAQILTGLQGSRARTRRRVAGPDDD